MQKPHPPIWIPGVISRRDRGLRAPSTATRTSRLDPPIERKRVWKSLRETAAQEPATRRAPRTRLPAADHVAETEEKAIRNARRVHVDAGAVHRRRPSDLGRALATAARSTGAPSRVRLGRGAEPARPAVARKADGRAFDHRRYAEAGHRQVRILLEGGQPGILGLWAIASTVTPRTPRGCIRLMGRGGVAGSRGAGQGAHL